MQCSSHHFSGLSSPSDIVVSPQYPGSPTADVTWCFPGESSHPSFFTVKVKTENEKVVYKTSVAAGKSKIIIIEQIRTCDVVLPVLLPRKELRH